MWTSGRLTGASSCTDEGAGPTQSCAADRCPLSPRQRRKSGHRPRSEKCQKATYAAQQIAVYSITLSARAMTVGGRVMPSLLAALRLMLNSNVIGCCIGKSVGLAPLRILSTYVADRRNSSGTLGP